MPDDIARIERDERARARRRLLGLLRLSRGASSRSAPSHEQTVQLIEAARVQVEELRTTYADRARTVELEDLVAAHIAFLETLTTASRADSIHDLRLASRPAARNYRAEFADFHARWQLERRVRTTPPRPMPLVGRPRLKEKP